ncbi:MAG: GNAT family N-acetyltransferase [Acetatifactor sp.]|nr:GNAT family N-acetyltransferase [Acetatifactor sp.]
MEMNLEIKKLSADLLNDWLNFFDHYAFTDHDEWAGCYCMCYHWNEALSRKKGWDCAGADASYNRSCAIDFIQKGKMQGYLAYDHGRVVGWCNANDKAAYDNVNFDLPADDPGRRGKAVVCFCISPEFRGKGVASQLLEKVCSDAAAEGYDYVEAYPFHHDANYAYHGPHSMYVKQGFEKHGNVNDCTILRKRLNSEAQDCLS